MDSKQWSIVMRSRNPDDVEYGNIDDVIETYGSRLSAPIMALISQGRGSCKRYGNLDNLRWEYDRYTPAQLTLVSLGLGSDPNYPRVDHLNPLTYCASKMRNPKYALKESL